MKLKRVLFSSIVLAVVTGHLLPELILSQKNASGFLNIPECRNVPETLLMKKIRMHS